MQPDKGIPPFKIVPQHEKRCILFIRCKIHTGGTEYFAKEQQTFCICWRSYRIARSMCDSWLKMKCAYEMHTFQTSRTWTTGICYVLREDVFCKEDFFRDWSTFFRWPTIFCFRSANQFLLWKTYTGGTGFLSITNLLNLLILLWRVDITITHNWTVSQLHSFLLAEIVQESHLNARSKQAFLSMNRFPEIPIFLRGVTLIFTSRSTYELLEWSW